jgi:hypothetical protein
MGPPPGATDKFNMSPRDGKIVGSNLDQVCGHTNCAEGLAYRAKHVLNYLRTGLSKMVSLNDSHSHHINDVRH